MSSLKDVVFTISEPPACLRNYVDVFWVSSTKSQHVLQILPNTHSALMTCTTPYGKGVVLAGPTTQKCVVPMLEGEIKVGAWLKPGARYNFQSLEPTQLIDSAVTGREMLAHKINTFEEAAKSISCPQSTLGNLQALLQDLLTDGYIQRDPLVDQFIDTARAQRGRTSVTALLEKIPLSYRQFYLRFRKYTGFTPKEFLKLQRLNTAMDGLECKDTTIALVAADSGYADHAHFARELRAVIGLTPSEAKNHQLLYH